MIIKAILFAVVMFLGSLTVVEAQVFFNGGAPGQFTVLGWNYGHLVNCYTQVDDSTTWFYAYNQEGGGYGVTNNPAFAIILSPACQTGNLVGVFVTSVNPLRWNVVSTFTFK